MTPLASDTRCLAIPLGGGGASETPTGSQVFPGVRSPFCFLRLAKPETAMPEPTTTQGWRIRFYAAFSRTISASNSNFSCAASSSGSQSTIWGTILR